jgi:hypothetical protein
MAIPHTKDGNVRFIENEPDWSQGMEVRSAWDTKILTNRDDSEQRARRQQTPKWSFTYALPNLDTDDASVRRSRQFRELNQLLVVPIWPFEMRSPSVVNTDDMDFTGHTDTPGMQAIGPKAGGYMFFEETGLTSVFRKIVSVTDLSFVVTITFESGNAAYPNIAVPAYTTAVKPRPCITGMRVDNSGSMAQHRVGWSDELIAVEEV